MSDLPWTQPELPAVEPTTRGYTRLDVTGPHDLMACGFKTKFAADQRCADLTGHRDRVLGPLEGPAGVFLSAYRTGRGWCVLRFPRWELQSPEDLEPPF